MELAVSSDNVAELNGLVDESISSTSYINDATVTAVLQDTGGNVLSTITLTYVAASNGDYLGNFPHSVTLVEGQEYDVIITAVSGAYQMVWKERITAQYAY